ncbi:MAG: anti-sigma factor [bacterium]|nr:anti-sigma factor [bacterium]
MKKECINPEKLSAFLDGELSEQERENIKSHVKDCPLCQKEAQGLTKLTELLNNSFLPIEPSPYFIPGLKQKIEDNEPMPAKITINDWISRIKHSLVPIGATALILLSFVAGNRIGNILYQKSSTAQEREIYTSVESSILNDSPESSLTNTYANLLPEEGER